MRSLCTYSIHSTTSERKIRNCTFLAHDLVEDYRIDTLLACTVVFARIITKEGLI